jgi:hypothetical protein
MNNPIRGVLRKSSSRSTSDPCRNPQHRKEGGTDVHLALSELVDLLVDTAEKSIKNAVDEGRKQCGTLQRVHAIQVTTKNPHPQKTSCDDAGKSQREKV